MFSHDTQLSLQVVVHFVNTAPQCSGSERLCDAVAVESFVLQHHVSDVNPRDYARLGPLHEVRERLRELFGVADPAHTAGLVNSLVAEAPMRPRLSDHDDYGWHLHYFSPEASLSEHLAVDGGIAIAHLVAAGESDRLRVCAAPDCACVLADFSRNRSKRYCDARTCGNRLNVAAYRERKRAAVATGD